MDYVSFIKEKMKEEDKEKPDNVIYVTDLVTCQALKEFYIGEGNDSASIHGKLIHHSIENLFDDNICRKELTVVYDLLGYKIVGRLDMLCGDEVVEIKTTKEMKLHHLYQLLIYMYILKKNKGVLLYINPSNIRQYEVENNYDGLVKVIDNLTSEIRFYIIRIDDDFLQSLIKLYKEKRLYAQFNQCSECFFMNQCAFHK